jgi:hypothetical protein
MCWAPSVGGDGVTKKVRLVEESLQAGETVCGASGGMTTHVNKVHHVTTITKVAKDLGEHEQ